MTKRTSYIVHRTLIAISLLIISIGINAQDCKSKLSVELQNMNGGVYAGLKVSLKSRTSGETYFATSNAKGIASFEVPCNTYFDATIPNYSKKLELLSVEVAGGTMEQVLTYAPDMIQKSQLMEMSASEKMLVDNLVRSLPDTLRIWRTEMDAPPSPEMYTRLSIHITDLDDLKLNGEMVYITGVKRKKTIMAKTDNLGHLLIYVLKGDFYTINFRYHPNYTSTESSYLNGKSTIDMSLSYIGTREIERRKKAEEERLKAEAKRLEEEKKKFEEYCRKLKITAEEGYRKRAEEFKSGKLTIRDSSVSAVLNRNNWKDKLIVCDLSGSMEEYSAQLTVWYQLHYQHEKNLQFVFFNDGDNMPDDLKKIGETGGIYYSPARGVDSLNKFAARVATAGSGGDVAENNMEALIKGIKMASPFKELVMIVDNNSPVKDIALLKNFNVPVHIILCGVDKEIMTDYLLIAWKTHGSVHTMEEDITRIADLSEGQKIVINKITYQVMGGSFVRVSKI